MERLMELTAKRDDPLLLLSYYNMCKEYLELKVPEK